MIANNGLEALERSKAEAFDVIFMDLEMPHMGGLEATARLRQEGGQNAAVPIVALTAHAMVEHEERCRAQGMSEFLSKPILVTELERVLVAVAGQRANANVRVS